MYEIVTLFRKIVTTYSEDRRSEVRIFPIIQVEQYSNPCTYRVDFGFHSTLYLDMQHVAENSNDKKFTYFVLFKINI